MNTADNRQRRVLIEVTVMAGALHFSSSRFRVVAIGASTGAPGHLEDIVATLPADLPMPIVIAQHLPANFTGRFAAQLDRCGALTCIEAESGMPLLPGVVYVAPGGQHMRIARGNDGATIEVSAEPEAYVYKPSADELLRSAATVFGQKTLGIVMTGIGRDGLEGARAIKATGGVVLTQDKATCAVYGMPRSCVEAGVSDGQLTPEQIAETLFHLSPVHGNRPTAA